MADMQHHTGEHDHHAAGHVHDDHGHGHDGPGRAHGAALPPEQPLDPASQSLADALRRSFSVLKVLMIVLVVLYFLSGIFTVKPGEQAVVLRFGDIASKGTPDAIKTEGWHWSLPFPIDSFVTVGTGEREMGVDFMFQLTDEEITRNQIDMKYSPLSPERDDYVVTGDANILHVSLIVKYRVADIEDYVTNVYPAPDPSAGARTRQRWRHYPEYAIMRNLTRDAVISTAARYPALDIRGDRQDEFLLSVASDLIVRLDELERAGRPLGIKVDPNTGVIAPKMEIANLEAIMPPPQTREAFDGVFSAETKKSRDITKAQSEADARLVEVAGPQHGELAAAIEREEQLLRELAAAESNGGDTAKLKEAVEAERKKVDELLLASSGRVRSIIKDAETVKDSIIQEAISDYQNYLKVLPEYKRNPEIFLARFRDEARSRAIAREDVVKVYVYEGADRYWLKIPRDTSSLTKEKEKDDAVSQVESAEIKFR